MIGWLISKVLAAQEGIKMTSKADAIRFAKVRRVGRVEHLPAILQLIALLDPEVLVEREIKIELARRAHRVVTVGAIAAKFPARHGSPL